MHAKLHNIIEASTHAFTQCHFLELELQTAVSVVKFVIHV